MRCNLCGKVVDEKCEYCPNCQKPLNNNQIGINDQKKAKNKVVEYIIVTISVFLGICFLISVLSITLGIRSFFKNINDTTKKCTESYECTLNEDGETYTCIRDWWVNETTEIVCEEEQLELHQFADSALTEKLESKDFIIKKQPINSTNGYYVLGFSEIEEDKKLYYKFNTFFEVTMFRDGDSIYINDSIELSLDASNEIKFYIYDYYLLYFNEYSYTNGIRNILLLEYDEDEKKISSSDLNENQMFINKIYEVNGKTRIELMRIINNNNYFDEKYKNDICNIDKNNNFIISETVEFYNYNSLYLESYVVENISLEDFIQKNNLCENRNKE